VHPLSFTLLFIIEDDTVEYVKDKKTLSKPCKPCGSLRHGKILGDRLLEILKEHKDGVGLSANQVGVDAAVCVINVVKPIVLINPKVISQFGKSFFQEACLSFPGDYILTERWTNIMVAADNHRQELVFSFDKNALECVCTQHEIDHLNGITMFDRAVNMEKLDGKN
jgi:peptide deformylase